MKLRIRKQLGMWMVSIAQHTLAGFYEFAQAQRFVNGEGIVLGEAMPPITLREALNELTENILGNYVQNHKLSRGAPVGRA